MAACSPSARVTALHLPKPVILGLQGNEIKEMG
jgi:hypothetical protein